MNRAYGLSAAYGELMWRTAPPRMPVGGKKGNSAAERTLNFRCPMTAKIERLVLNDSAIRSAMKGDLLLEQMQDPATLVIDELGLKHGRVRADIVVVNAALSAFEIKSARDNLKRLPQQIHVYGCIADYATLVTVEKYVEPALSLLPTWWGLEVAEKSSAGSPRFSSVRTAQPNPEVDPISVARLLWREEALALLVASGTRTCLRRTRRADLYNLLAQLLPLDTLRAKVREFLRLRTGWRSE